MASAENLITLSTNDFTGMDTEMCRFSLVDGGYGKTVINQIDAITDGIYDPTITIIFI